MTDYTKGYLEGIIEAQKKIYGYNFIKEVLPQKIVEEVVEVCELQLSNLYHQDLEQMVADAVGMEVSSREREEVLKTLGEKYRVDLYSGSRIPDSFSDLKIREKGLVDYQKEVPYIFYNSKINLNITSKTIETGIPLRIFDILSCGGFCLTNFQPEIAEYFVDGEELVMYTGMEDLMEKVSYYLEHNEERKMIARNGYEKLKREHDLSKIFMELLAITQSY